MPKLHQYPVTVAWTGGRDGHGAVAAERSGAHLQLAVPEEFGGHGQGSNPEELLVAAIGACYTITYGLIATTRKLPLLEVKAQVIGQVEEDGPQVSVKRIVVKPRITLVRDATEEDVTAAFEYAHRADKACMVSNAVRGKVEIVVEPDVVRG